MTEDFSKYNGEGTTLRKAQLRMLDILIEVDKICKKHDIPYWLEGGTLLGAVRHGGFIPWDDDLDISMEIHDYNRFKQFINELPEQYAFQDDTTDKNYFCVFSKIRDKKSYFYDPLWTKVKEQGIYIDIFPHEKMPSKKWETIVEYIYGNVHRWAHDFYPQKYKKIIGAILLPFAKCFVAGCRFIFRLSSDKYLLPACGVTSFRGVVKYKNDIFPCKKIQFEGYEFSCPNNPDKYLREIYGDYKQLPPEEKRHPDHAGKIEFYD